MSRTLVCIGLFAVCSVLCRAGEQSEAPETVIRLNVAPAPSPSPALRYRLLPGLEELEPGNPIEGYFRALLAHQKFLVDDEASQWRERLLAMPLKALPTDDVKDYERSVLLQADRAARLDRPDWQILPRLKTEGFALLLPDVQQMRSLARGLAVRFRAEVATRNFNDAIRTAKTMLAIARHLGEHPTIIGNLIGIAVAQHAFEPLQEMMEQPGCPNLYWALTTLPTPFISMVSGLEGERLLLATDLRDLDEQAPMSAAQIKRFAVRWDSVLANATPSTPGKRVQDWLDARTGDKEVVAAARSRLVAHGLPEERLLRFPASQVILLDEKRECQARLDDLIKTMFLPIVQIDARNAQLMRAWPPALVGDDVLQWTTHARRARGRLEQRIALLRHVEALRLHTAEHDGHLPAKLTDVSVPLPDDPFTGKPFPYELRDGTAILRGTPPVGAETMPGYKVRFEITLRE